MSWKRFVQDYLIFSKKERLAAMCLLLIGLSIYILPKTFSKSNTQVALLPDTTLLQIRTEKKKIQPATDNNEEQKVSFSFYEPTVNKGFTEGSLFTFDPNTLPAEGWQKLGLNDRTIKTIHNYRNKGGRFYKKEDLKKIWGLPAAFYQRVESYIAIPTKQTYRTNNTTTYIPNNTTVKEKRGIAVVPVNEADTTALIALPGIGSKLAARIVNFRDKLGGFYSTEQIGETYGLPDSTFRMLKPYLLVDAAAIKKINLNTATKDELRTHPYIKWALANAIVEYRNQHGTFNSIADLKNIMLVDEATFQKIAPYFSL